MMKKILLFFVPLLIAVLVFFGILFFLDKKTGKGALQVTSVPQSDVYLDGKFVGKTPFCMAAEKCEIQDGIDVGKHDIELVPTDKEYPSYNTKITVNKLTLTAVDRTFGNNGESDGAIISLSSLSDKKDAEISVISLPDKANVFLDGNPVGITPLLLKQVGESDHDLKITFDGYRDKTLKIKTTLGFKLTSFVFLGTNTDLSASQIASATALPTASSSASVLILNTPTGFLRVREGNSISSSEIGRISPGESYELIGETDDWFKIKFGSRGAELGWISAQYAVKE